MLTRELQQPVGAKHFAVESLGLDEAETTRLLNNIPVPTR